MIRELKENYKKAKAEFKGEARSQARLVYNGTEIPELAGKLNIGQGRAHAIPAAFVRMKDGDPMQFYSDGSLRHALGKKPGKAARKEAKRLKRARNSHTKGQRPVVHAGDGETAG